MRFLGATRLPLYRQAEIFARDGVTLETSTLSGWVGATAAVMTPLVDALAAEVISPDALHVDDTPVPVLAPGTGKTKTGRLWTYVRDERPFAGARPPAALFPYSADRNSLPSQRRGASIRAPTSISSGASSLPTATETARAADRPTRDLTACDRRQPRSA